MSTDPNSMKEIVRRSYDILSPALEIYNDEARYRGLLAPALESWSDGAAALDLGCGSGVLAARLLVEAGFRVTGVDLSPVQIERARAAVPGAAFVCGDMSDVVFDDGSFDVVLALWSMIHVPQDEQVALLGRIARWLRSGGVFVGALGWDAWTSIEEDWLGVSGATMCWDHPDAATYQRWLRDAGLTAEQPTYLADANGVGGHGLFVARKL